MSDFIYRPPREPFLNRIYEDGSLILVIKPSGLLSVPGRGADRRDSVLARVQLAHPGARAVHRLDLDTSGLLAVALDAQAAGHLGKQFSGRRVKKIYLAEVWGEVRRGGAVSLPVRCDWERRPLQMVDPERGRPALTFYEPLWSDGRTSILRLIPRTGRSHQLRVHLSAVGHPIVGDRFYGRSREEGALRLHAAFLSFKHPLTEERLSFASRPDFASPELMERALAVQAPPPRPGRKASETDYLFK